MSQETSFTFKELRKRSKVQIEIEGNENDPFTISGGEFSLDFDLPTDIITGVGAPLKQKLELKNGDFLPDFLGEQFDYGKLSCKPLEEVDPEYINKQTFLVIGRDGKVHRLSAKESTFIFNPFNRLRRIGILILSNWQLPVLIGLSLCFLCLSFVLPNYASNSVSTVVWNFTRYIFGGILFAEICVNLLARGVLVAEFTYLRSPWDWFDVTICAIIFLNFYWGNLFSHSVEGVALFKFIPIIPALKTGFQVTIQILKNAVPVLIYSLLTLWILVVVGFHIKYSQSAPRNCELSINGTQTDNQYQYESYESQRNYNINLPNSGFRAESEWNGSTSILNSSSNNCIENYTLATSITNITFQTADIITNKAFGGFTNEIAPLQNHFLYVILTLIFGTLGVSVLTAASVGLSLVTLRLSLGDNYKGRKFTCLPDFQIPKCDIGALNRINELVFHPFFELFLTAVICLDILLISLSFIKSPELLRIKWIIKNGQEVCMIVYLVEFVGKVVTGPARYFRNWWPFLDFIIVTSFILDKFYPLSFLLQIRIFKITPRWPTLQLIFCIIFECLQFTFPFLCILMLAMICVRITAVKYVNGLLTPEKSLVFGVGQSFLFDEWSQLLSSCESGTGSYMCLAIWLVEVIIGIVFVAVLFVTVISCTCDLLSRPAIVCEHYENLVKAVQFLKRGVNKCCTKALGRSDSSNELNQVRPNRPVQITLNGGPKIVLNDSDLEELDSAPPRPQNSSRKCSQVSLVNLVKNLHFQHWTSILIIVIATSALVLNYDPLQGLSPNKNPRLFIDFLFVLYFLVILVWKFVKHNFKSFKSPPWLLDFVVVSASGFTLYTSTFSKLEVMDLPAIKLITTLSCLRGLMLINRLEWLKIGVIGVTFEIRVLWRYIIGLFLVWVYLLWLKNYQTISSSGSDSKWLSDAIASLSSIETITKIIIKISILLCYVLISGILVGVTVFELHRTDLLASFMTPAQCTTYKDKELSIHREKTVHIPAPKGGLCIPVTHYLTLTNGFDLTVMTTIICDCLVITFSHLATSKDWRIIWSHYPPFIILTYCCELIMKLIGWRKYFLKSGWNVFDCFVVGMGIIDLLIIKVQIGFITADTIRFLRIIRFFQLSLFKKHAKLVQISFSALLRVAPSIGNLMLLYGILLHTYSGICFVNVLNASSSPGFVENVYIFKNIVVSLMTLPFYGEVNNFQIVETHPCWTEFLGVVLLIYIYSFLVLSYLILGSVFAISLYEILNAGSKSSNLDSKCDPVISDRETRYKHTNGGFLNCDCERTPDDPGSVGTMLTPIEPLAEDPLTDEEKYPLRISANGYILHVEAIVTTV